MKYYTRSGDDGYTSLLGDARVPKYAPRPEAYGTIDEVTSAMGLARATASDARTREILLDTQRQLYLIMAELAATPEAADHFHRTTADEVFELERLTDDLGDKVTLPKEFVIPGDTLAGAALDVARAMARRAERIIARLIHNGEFGNIEVMRFLNRLSSLLFVLARYEESVAGVTNITLARRDP